MGGSTGNDQTSQPEASPAVIRELQEFDSEIQRMSRHADEILESIRSVAEKSPARTRPTRTRMIPPEPPSCRDNARDKNSSKRSNHSSSSCEDEVDEDDSMMEEMERLELISASLRESLIGGSLDRADGTPLLNMMEDDGLRSGKTSKTKVELTSTDEKVQESKRLEELLLACTLVWTVLIILVTQAWYFLLDPRGYIRLPFGLGMASHDRYTLDSSPNKF